MGGYRAAVCEWLCQQAFPVASMNVSIGSDINVFYINVLDAVKTG